MRRIIQLKRNIGFTSKMQLSFITVDNNYFNLKQNQNLLDEGILIANESSSLQLQLDLQYARQAFVIGFKKDQLKVGVSVNYIESKAPFSLMLAEKYYLIVPFDKSFKPEQISSFSFED